VQDAQMKVEGRRQGWAAMSVVVVMAAALAWWGQPAPPPAPDADAGAATLEPRLTSQTTLSANVVQLMVSGNGALGRGTTEGTRQARQAYEQAVPLDERYAPAQAALAQALVQLGASGAEKPDAVLPTAITHADRAIELDPTLALGWQALAQAEVQWKRDWERAEMHYRRAMALAPQSPVAPLLLARLLVATGRSDEAVAASLAALKLGPQSSDLQVSAGIVHRFAGRIADALPYFEQALVLDPHQPAAISWRAATLAELGRLDEALDVALGAPVVGGSPAPWVTGYVQALRGQSSAAEELFNALAVDASKRYVPALQFVYLSCALDRRPQALEWLETAVREHSPGVEMMAVDPILRPLRHDPRFDAALKAMNLGAGQ
jgi:tetratricopeptide (TPR) repeat protein